MNANTDDDEPLEIGHAAKGVAKKFKPSRASQRVKHGESEQDEPLQSSRRTRSKKRVMSSDNEQESGSQETDDGGSSLSPQSSGLEGLGKKNPSALKRVLDGEVSARRPSSLS